MSREKKHTAPESEIDSDRTLLIRTVIFGVVVAVLAGTSLFFVFGIVTHQGDLSEVELSAGGSYTVKLFTENKDKEALLIQYRDRFQEGFGEEVFVIPVGENKIALCIGRFESRNSEKALAVLEKVKDTELGRRAEISFVSQSAD